MYLGGDNLVGKHSLPRDRPSGFTTPRQRERGFLVVMSDPKNGKPREYRLKTAVSPINGAVIPLGAHPGNTGGKKGRSGRPTKEAAALRARMRAQLDDVMEAIGDGLLTRVQNQLQNPLFDPQKYVEMLARYGVGTNDQTEMTVNDAVFTPEERAARVLELVRKADQRAKRA